MTADESLSIITDERSLSDAWIDACGDDAVLDEPLDLEAAARFLHAMAVVLAAGGGAYPGDTTDTTDASDTSGTAFDTACRTFAWASGSAERAVRRLAALRVALQTVLPSGTSTVRDIVDRLLDRAMIAVVRQTTDELERDALLDPLTGLLNRRALLRDLEGEIGRASRSGVGFCVVFLDVDGLKTVNDGEGHRAGDVVLVRLAESLLGVLRRGDSAYRIGGDEFVLVLPATTLVSVNALIDRLCMTGSPPFSWGAAAYPVDGTSVEGLLDEADARLIQRRRRLR